MHRSLEAAVLNRVRLLAICGLLVALVILAMLPTQPLSAAPAQPTCPSQAQRVRTSSGCLNADEGTATAAIDENRVQLLPHAGIPSGGASASSLSLSYPDFTYRHHWGWKNGWWILTLTDSRIRKTSNVVVSASEVSDIVSTVDPVPQPFVGAARYQVYNVAPANGSVTIRLFIDWPSALGTEVSYLVLNP